MEITLEMVDKVIERTGVSYLEAKEALKEVNGDVLDAIILIEENYANKQSCCETIVNSETVEDMKTWIKKLIKSGNATRIRILKDDVQLCDIPVNAGVSAGVIALCLPPVLAFGVIAAVVTKITIEITRPDGSVEVVNKYISKAVSEVKEKASEMSGVVKEKASEMGDVVKDKVNGVKNEATNRTHYSAKVKKDEEQVFSYTIKFDDEK